MDRPERTERPDHKPSVHRGRRKVCAFCVDKIYDIDYKASPRRGVISPSVAKLSPP